MKIEMLRNDQWCMYLVNSELAISNWKYMKAEEAKKIADEVVRLAELKELEPLLVKIREAAANGKTSLIVDKLPNSIRKQLNKIGYTIRSDSQSGEQDSIDWSNPGSSSN